jgi:predicted RNA binding protein YcfA (HicA-like mRNA interferase family)
MRPDVDVRLSVPVHGNKPLKVGLFTYLLKAAGIDPGDLD